MVGDVMSQESQKLAEHRIVVFGSLEYIGIVLTFG